MKYFLYIFIPLILHFTAVAQTTDTLFLKTIEITSQKKTESDFNKTISLDTTQLKYLPAAHIGEILQRYSPIFIKSYGINGLNTPAFRGTSANHTLVEWNGLELNSAMNGQFDLSSLPTFFTDEIKIKYGAASLNNTIGGFGGLLQLKTNTNYFPKPKIKILHSYETLENNFTTLNLGFSKKQFSHQTAVLYKNHNNTFTYTNPFLDNKKETLNHANNLQYGMMQQYAWFTKNSGTFSLDAWYSSDNRKLPPLIGTSINAKEQQNTENFRTAFSWKTTWKAGTLNSTNGFVYEQMQYKDDNKNMDFIHYNNTVTNKLLFHSIKTRLGYFNIAAHYKFNDVSSDNYNAYHTRNTVGSFGEWLCQIGKKYETIIHLGEEFINNTWMPGSGYLGINFNPLPNHLIIINATAGKNYRYPTMNDMYWEIYGNPYLLPEINYSYELNSILKKTINKFTIHQQLTFYYSKTKAMIVWQPVTALLWQPLNLNTVEAKGIEIQNITTYKTKNTSIQSNINYTFNNVIAIHSNINDTNIIQKQLPYNPQHNIAAALDISWNKFFVNSHLQFTSDYFLNYQNTYLQPYSDYMPWYSIVSISTGKNWHYKNTELTTALSIQNLFNNSYMVMPGRPMPGRYFQCWIAAQIN